MLKFLLIGIICISAITSIGNRQQNVVEDVSDNMNDLVVEAHNQRFEIYEGDLYYETHLPVSSRSRFLCRFW